eukprot:COSAG02_NODE_3617_length_6471_cov_4.987759_4_plen_411_part_00
MGRTAQVLGLVGDREAKALARNAVPRRAELLVQVRLALLARQLQRGQARRGAGQSLLRRPGRELEVIQVLGARTSMLLEYFSMAPTAASTTSARISSFMSHCCASTRTRTQGRCSALLSAACRALRARAISQHGCFAHLDNRVVHLLHRLLHFGRHRQRRALRRPDAHLALQPLPTNCLHPKGTEAQHQTHTTTQRSARCRRSTQARRDEIRRARPRQDSLSVSPSLPLALYLCQANGLCNRSKPRHAHPELGLSQRPLVPLRAPCLAPWRAAARAALYWPEPRTTSRPKPEETTAPPATAQASTRASPPQYALPCPARNASTALHYRLPPQACAKLVRGGRAGRRPPPPPPPLLRAAQRYNRPKPKTTATPHGTPSRPPLPPSPPSPLPRRYTPGIGARCLGPRAQARC